MKSRHSSPDFGGDNVIDSTFRRLKWVGFVVPLAFLFVFLYLVEGPVHDLLHSAWGFLTLLVVLTLAVISFALLMIIGIRRIHQHLQNMTGVADVKNLQLRALNEATLALSEERSLSSVLQRVVDLSQELVGARYAALGVLSEDGRLSAFLTSGIDQETRQAIGPPPEGKGLLGYMLKRTDALRVDSIASHPESVGFPEGHPKMEAFLGRPSRYKGKAVG
ncbi:MAG: GAF domain-containing protein, partial [Chloroflexi bacterium]|nr:GAF domain-containing protein [Chloroflexota bacterium]